MQCVKDIRNKFANLYKNQQFIIDKTGVKVVEIIGESFEADEPFIFGKVNSDYAERELQWYLSQSLNVNDIPGEVPKIWKRVADKDGFINSNYGWCVFSKENGNQYENTKNELLDNNFSRRATMIYNRPTMWDDYNKNGRSDFCCTYATQHFIRNSELITYVLMRSNDVIFGYRNDFYWHEYVTKKLFNDLRNYISLNKFKIIWTSGSLHIYEQQFYLIDHFINTGDIHIDKKEYNELYNKTI